jgi:hypothetical protein
MAGKIIADTLEHSTAGSIATNYVVDGSAKAWCNFEQAATHTVRDSLNISSLNDDGSGLTDTNYTSSFGNSDYVAGGHAGRQAVSAVTAYWLFPTADGGTIVYSTSSTSWTGGYSIGTSSDLQEFDLYLALCTVHGDLA